MSAILIRGRKAPSCCASCNSELAAAVDCIYTKRLILPEEHDMRTGRHPDCPIIPVSDASFEEKQIWHPVGLPPAESGRYNVLCTEWGGWKSRTVSFLAAEKVWIDDSGRDITGYIAFWTDFPAYPKKGEDHV